MDNPWTCSEYATYSRSNILHIFFHSNRAKSIVCVTMPVIGLWNPMHKVENEIHRFQQIIQIAVRCRGICCSFDLLVPYSWESSVLWIYVKITIYALHPFESHRWVASNSSPKLLCLFCQAHTPHRSVRKDVVRYSKQALPPALLHNDSLSSAQPDRAFLNDSIIGLFLSSSCLITRESIWALPLSQREGV